jgi:hypothetical protein
MGWFDNLASKIDEAASKMDEAVTGGLFSDPMPTSAQQPASEQISPAAPAAPKAPAEPETPVAAEEDFTETIAPTSRKSGLPAEEPYRKQIAKEAEKRRASVPEIVGKAFEMNDVKDLQDLLKPEMSALPQWEKKLEDAKRIYDERSAALGEKEATLSMIGLFTQLVLGMYGVKHGVDTSGIRFDKINWDNEFKQLARQYDKDSEYLIKRKEMVKEKIAQKYRMYNEQQQITESGIRDYEKERMAEWEDRLRAIVAEEREGRAGSKLPPKTAEVMGAEAQLKQMKDKLSSFKRGLGLEQQAMKFLSGAAVMKGKDRKKALATHLGKSEDEIKSLLSPEWFSDSKENYQEFLAERQAYLKNKEAYAANSSDMYRFAEGIVKERLTPTGNLVEDMREFNSLLKEEQKKNPSKDPALQRQATYVKYLKMLKEKRDAKNKK